MPDSQQAAPPKIAIVLPVTLAERQVHQTAWRHVDNNLARVRLQLLLSSLLHFFDLSTVSSFWIVSPVSEIGTIKQIAASTGIGSYVDVIAEDEIFTSAPVTGRQARPVVAGWKLQQLIKLGVALYVRANHYLTLDSDIVCLHKCGAGTLIPNRKPLLNLETLSDYQRLYTPDFASSEVTRKRSRMLTASSILRLAAPRDAPDRFCGETPVLLSADAVTRLLKHLSNLYSEGWLMKLIQTDGWTEFALYLSFLQGTGSLVETHQLASCDEVLSLTDSVWQCNCMYRTKRTYAPATFFAHARTRMTGHFAAVQSWLPAHCWLSSEYGSIKEYYELLNVALRAEVEDLQRSGD